MLLRTPISIEKKLGMVAYSHHPNNGGEKKIRRRLSRPTWAKNKPLSLKLPEQKRAGDKPQMVE
jgi:hypothetical protein